MRIWTTNHDILDDKSRIYIYYFDSNMAEIALLMLNTIALDSVAYDWRWRHWRYAAKYDVKYDVKVLSIQSALLPLFIAGFSTVIFLLCLTNEQIQPC